MSDDLVFLGPYRLGKTLGRGGMGSVYEAQHEKTGERVAVKLIAAAIADEPKFRRRFNGEIETLKRLHHENIVRLIGYGEENGQLFYSMELVDGEVLHARIRREKRIDWKAAIDIAIQICAALRHAHNIGVIHRDLKPANLLLTKDGTVKLVDFGISKLFGYGEQTAAGSILGTADYMAPEQATGDPVTHKTDLYALGSVMYAMLSGRPAFKGKRVTDVIVALKRDKPIPLEMINLDLPDALSELVHELLEKDPNDRPPTALVTMNRLKAMRAGLEREETLSGQRDNTSHSEPESTIDDGTIAGTLNTADSANRDGTAIEAKQNVDASAGTARGVKSGSKDKTLASKIAETLNTETEDGSHGTLGGEKTTHFQTVDESRGVGSGTKHETSERSISQIWSLALMVGLLAAGLGVIVYVLNNKPSADELYEKILQVTATQRLEDARPEIESFIELFPQHERINEVESMHKTLELSALMRRLRLRYQLGRQLSAPEQALLNALDLREQDSEIARKKLNQWLDVFNIPDQSEPIREMAELVEFESERLLEQGPTTNEDKRSLELLARIEQAANADISDQKRILNAIVELYGDEAWARNAVEQARKKLAKLE